MKDHCDGLKSRFYHDILFVSYGDLWSFFTFFLSQECQGCHQYGDELTLKVHYIVREVN